MNKLVLVGLGCVALAGCSRPPEHEASSGRDLQTFDAASPPPAAPAVPGASNRAPGIDVTAAPGVAFVYRYGFRMPSARIGAVQEAHAQACEKLGIARCRITGMRYRLLGENNIEAALEFKLAPELARGFGKDGIALVERSDGTLVDAEITGTDAGATIDRSGVERARAGDELHRLDAQIARSTRAAERAELQTQRADAARRIAAATDTAADARASLAQTPVTFTYGSGPAVRGFDTSAPISSALDTAVASIQATFAVLLGALAILGPPLLAIGLVLWLFTRARAVWRRRTPAASPPTGD